MYSLESMVILPYNVLSYECRSHLPSELLRTKCSLVEFLASDYHVQEVDMEGLIPFLLISVIFVISVYVLYWQCTI